MSEPGKQYADERLDPKGNHVAAGQLFTYDEWKYKQSQRIYQLRAQTGLTQKEFATLVGWSASQQSQLEQNTDSVRIRPMHVMTARFVAEHPLEALKSSHALSEKVREKVVAYAERIRDFGMP